MKKETVKTTEKKDTVAEKKTAVKSTVAKKEVKKTAAQPAIKKTACKKSIVKKEETDMGKKVKFTFNGKPGCKVFLVGSFNNWQEDKKQLVDKNNSGEYSCTCIIKHGHYEYKFLVDGIWMMDNTNPNFVKNTFGSLNNVLDV